MEDPTNKTVKLDITQADIDAGVKGDCGQCPIALAAWRVFPDVKCVAVDDCHIDVVAADGDFWQAENPGRASCFVSNFDDGQPVEPFSFEATFVRID